MLSYTDDLILLINPKQYILITVHSQLGQSLVQLSPSLFYFFVIFLYNKWLHSHKHHFFSLFSCSQTIGEARQYFFYFLIILFQFSLVQFSLFYFIFFISFHFIQGAKPFTLFKWQFLSPYCTEDIDLRHFSTVLSVGC